MRFLLCPWLLLAGSFFCALQSYSQQDADTRPKVILKVNPYPLFMFFTKHSSAGIGYEVRIGERWTIAGGANIRYNSPFKTNYYQHNGFLLVQEIRKYKLHTKLNWDLGLNTMWANSVDMIDANFNQNGSIYSKQVRHEYNSFGLHIISGIQPQIKSSRFTIDICGGMGASYQKSHFTNLTEAEMTNLTANTDPFNLNNYDEILDRKIGNRFTYSIYFGFYIGYILSR